MPRPRGSHSKPDRATAKALRAVGERIRAERVRRTWTLEKLAGRTGLEAAYLARVEAGGVNVTFRSLHRIARGLRVTIGRLTDE